MRGGVPVFILPAWKPKRTKSSVIPTLFASAILPPPKFFVPIWINPFKNVPLVTTIDLPNTSYPIPVLTEFALPFFSIMDTTLSCMKSTFGFLSSSNLHSSENLMRSDCALGLYIAAPFERFSILNCSIVLSVTMPDIPPRASISLIIWPLATPPIAGLQLIFAMVSMFMVIRITLEPIVAAACAASQPACPAPITITSYSFFMLLFHVERF